MLKNLILNLFRKPVHDDAQVENQNDPAARGASLEELLRQGQAAEKNGDLSAAETHYRRCVEMNLSNPDAWFCLGSLMKKTNRIEDAITCYNKSVEIAPGFFSGYLELASVYENRGDLPQATACYLKALELKPDYAEIHGIIGNIYKAQRKPDSAIGSYQTALQLKPDFAEACYNLGLTYHEVGLISQAEQSYRRAIALKPGFSSTHSSLLCLLSLNRNYDAGEVYSEHCEWAREHAEPLSEIAAVHGNLPDPERILRVGYVSADFRDHAAAYFIEPMLACRDRSQYEVYCYHNSRKADGFTKRLQGFAAGWREIAGAPDADVADQVRRDAIDILVDLSGHTLGNRLLVFARKPAPVQVTYLGYPNTTGMKAMDYRITDAYADPLGTAETHYTEQLIRLPDSMWCYRPQPHMPPVNDLPALKAGCVTFGSFNNIFKINPELIQVWSRLLLAIPGSRLIMVTIPEGETWQRIEAWFRQSGIMADRLELIERLPSAEFWRLHHRVDVALDPFPCNGGTTTCESLWMGVPVITLTGQSFVSRAGFSLLSNLGLTELIAHTPEEYVAIGVWIAADLERLAEMRREMRGRMQRSPLTDAVQFTRNLEAAYRDIWRSWCGKH